MTAMTMFSVSVYMWCTLHQYGYWLPIGFLPSYSFLLSLPFFSVENKFFCTENTVDVQSSYSYKFILLLCVVSYWESWLFAKFVICVLLKLLLPFAFSASSSSFDSILQVIMPQYYNHFAILYALLLMRDEMIYIYMIFDLNEI